MNPSPLVWSESFIAVYAVPKLVLVAAGLAGDAAKLEELGEVLERLDPQRR